MSSESVLDCLPGSKAATGFMAASIRHSPYFKMGMLPRWLSWIRMFVANSSNDKFAIIVQLLHVVCEGEKLLNYHLLVQRLSLKCGQLRVDPFDSVVGGVDVRETFHTFRIDEGFLLLPLGLQNGNAVGRNARLLGKRFLQDF